MKNKVFIIIICLLVVLIVGIQYKMYTIGNITNKQNSGQVKSAQTILHKNPELPQLHSLIFVQPPECKKQNCQANFWADAYVLYDTNSGYPLIKKNANKKMPIASITKIMTAVVVLENYNLNDIITISQNAASQIGSDVYLKTGEKITVKELLKALLIESGNDAAMALAEQAGSKEKFVEMMNEKANYLSLKDTEFKDPAGLDDSGRSSVLDLAKLTAYALHNPIFAEIVKMQEVEIYSTDGKFSHKLESSNRLVKPDEPLYMPEAIGVKTGFTPDAGHCLVAAAEKDGHRLISVVLKTFESSKEASAKESKKILQYGFENFKWD